MSRGLLPYRRNALRTSFDSVFDKLFEDFERAFTTVESSWLSSVGNYPRVNLTSYEDRVTIEASVPGMKEEDVEIEYSNGSLVIRGKSQNSNGAEKGNVCIRELHKSSFTRTFPLDESLINVNDIRAKMKDGILTITLPKVFKEKQKEVRKIPLDTD